MTKTAIIGMQFGDEAKAKMISYFLKNKNYDVVARYGGGANAGHTQIGKHGDEVITHVVPGGILDSSVYNLILADVMIDPLGIVEEIKDLREMGYKVEPSNLGISSRAQMTLKYHKDFEKKSERKKGRHAVGTTMRGIGPTAVSKYGREGLRFAEFVNPESFELLLKSLSRKRGSIAAKSVPVEKYMEMYEDTMTFLKQFEIDETKIIMMMKDKEWLYEGAQGILLDVLYGTIPYVTSSTPHNPPSDTDERVGIAKAYITRVGGGNLPTRMEPNEEKNIRGVRGETPGAEFGATTGRPRNCGWFDAVAARFAANVGRIDKVALTKLDRLSGFPKIKVATSYEYNIFKGATQTVSYIIDDFPADRLVFNSARAVYEEYPGWMADITSAREQGDLPQNAMDYIKRIEDMIERKISHVSVGQGAEETIELI